MDWATIVNPEKEFHERRKNTIGSSDMPIILKLSPYKTPLELWRIKTGLVEPEQQNFAQARGSDMEPIARDWFNKRMLLEFKPKLFTHPDVPQFTASLDGYCEKTNQALEIKFSGKKDHTTAKSGKIPPHYAAQCKWQYIVSKADHIYYLSYQDGDSIILDAPKPTEEETQHMITEAAKFLHSVQTKTPPELTADDFFEVDTPGVLDLANKYADLLKQAEIIMTKAEPIKAQLIEFAKHFGHPKTQIGKLKITKTTRKGEIDYSKVKGVDLEQYRKPEKEIYTLRTYD